METAFFSCATSHPFSIISSDGVRNLSQVRIDNFKFSGFHNFMRLPLIPEDIVDGAKPMVAALRSRAMINDISFADVLNELRLRPLSETETVRCLEWWRQGNTFRHSRDRGSQATRLLGALVVSVSGPPKKTMKLSDARSFITSKTEVIFPTDGPLDRKSVV